jgi:hypothetical protein
MSLWSEFLSNNGLRTMKSCHYFPIYEEYFSRFRNLDVTVFEIGVWQGGSLQLWKKYFGPHAKIVGIDIEEKCRGAEEDQVFVRIGQQGDIAFLNKLIEEFGVPDIVVDDGSHKMKDMNVTFNHLYPKLPKNGVYVVEDTFFSYWEREGATGTVEAPFIERTKLLIDSLHAGYTRGKVKADDALTSTSAIHVYDGVIVFERRGRIHRVEVTGSRSLFGNDTASNGNLSQRLTDAVYGNSSST